MCYAIKVMVRNSLERIKYWNEQNNLNKWLQEHRGLDEFHQVSGFDHPKIIVYTNQDPFKPIVAQWGLIPHWVEREKEAYGIWNKTINARGETIFEKPSFRDAAKSNRCIVPVSGFYEYHYYKGKKYPFFVHQKEEKTMNLAGVWSEWGNKESGEIRNTFSIVTTKANPMMQKIHNNPKLLESRMPVILPEGSEDDWLKMNGKEDLQELIKAYPEEKLKAHTVKRLKGKDSPGNVPEASEEFVYEDLLF